jgi:hypothetical protein
VGRIEGGGGGVHCGKRVECVKAGAVEVTWKLASSLSWLRLSQMEPWTLEQ